MLLSVATDEQCTPPPPPSLHPTHTSHSLFTLPIQHCATLYQYSTITLTLTLPSYNIIQCTGVTDNANFASQVAAMEARAKQLHLPPKTLHYLWPQGPGDSPGRTDFAPTAADARQINALGLGQNILSDIHGNPGRSHGQHRKPNNNTRRTKVFDIITGRAGDGWGGQG